MASIDLAIWPWILLVLSGTMSSTFTGATVQEGDALYAMMRQWKGPADMDGPIFPTWTLGSDPCVQGWENVTCNTGGNVVKLNVSNRGIQGGFPHEIGMLTHLEVLDMSNFLRSRDRTPLPPMNNLTGPFPDSLANCVNLRSLNISFQGWQIPFPRVVTKLAYLEEFWAFLSNLTGPIPDDFFHLSGMTSVNLGQNSLVNSASGNVLESFANFKHLEWMSLYYNNFSQTIPPVLGTLENLSYFNCHHCGLYGGLPDSFSNLKNLRNVTLHVNSLTGSIPDSWRKIKTMSNLRIDSNFIYGAFPDWVFTEWPLLDSLFLSRNLLYSRGDIPLISTLEQTFNISSRFAILRWDCNYLQGIRPCVNPANPCSERTLFKTQVSTSGGFNSSFNFATNCYSDATKQERDSVPLQCGTSHILYCEDFYNNVVIAGACPECPRGQNLVSPASKDCICGFQSTGRKRGGVPIGAVIGAVVGLGLLFVLILLLVIWKKRKSFVILDIFTSKKSIQHADEWQVPQGVTRFTIQDLAGMTQDFSDKHLIGHGGFGKVFYGTLDNGNMVAIKRAFVGSDRGIGEFRNEVLLLSRLHHRNLVRLEGFCEEDNSQILVYEFMPKGNLASHLRGSDTTKRLHCYTRLEIAYSVAQGLEYLHSFADPPVIHRDVKPTNILLDENMVAKLADFGISKESADYETHVSTTPAGTAGYLDPDYFLRQQLTSASDVYAFGVVLLELITGQPAVDHKREEETNLVQWAKKRFRTAGIISIIDPLMEGAYSAKAYHDLAELALTCTSFDKGDRPSMKAVLAYLVPLLELQAQCTPRAPSQNSSTRRRMGSVDRLLSMGTSDSTNSSWLDTTTDWKLQVSGPR